MGYLPTFQHRLNLIKWFNLMFLKQSLSVDRLLLEMLIKTRKIMDQESLRRLKVFIIRLCPGI